MIKMFDVIIQNPPYNPNSLWKKFVLKSIDQLKDDGKMVVIHPDSWRKKSSNIKFFNDIKYHISELYLTGFKSFDANISTDWYVYNKQTQEKMSIKYENNDIEIVNTNIERIYAFSQKSIPASIIKKITKINHNNGLINLSANSYGFEYTEYIENGKYKQCGGVKRGTSWTKGDYHLTDKPTKYQFENKIVMSYTRKLRATFFKNTDEIGCNRGYIILTDNINSGTKDMKFDVIVMNPPYNEGLLTQEYKDNINNLYSGDLVKKAIRKRIDSTFIIHSYEKLLKDGGELTAVWPIKWMQLSSWQNFRNWNNSVGLTSFKILPRDTFKDADINVGITRYTKTEHISDTFLYENKEFSELVQKSNNILPLLDNKIEESIFNKIKTHKQLIKLDRKKTTTYALGTSSAITSEDDININSTGLGASSAMGPLRINKPGKFYINCNNELEYNNWINFYYSPFASFYVFMYSVDWNASLLNIGMLPDINIIFKNKEYNKKDLYNYFKFTTEEIKYLENKAMLYFKVDGIENKKRAEKKH